MTPPILSSITPCLERYDALLLDPFGVLVHSGGAIDGAVALIHHLHATAYPYLVLTNDASRSVEALATWYGSLGMPIPPDRIITSGSLLTNAWRELDLHGAATVVLGTPDSHRYVRQAGGEIVELTWDVDADVLAVCDDHGFDLLESLDRAVSLLYRRFDQGRPVHLLLPNPDLLYPRGGGRFGFTSGAIALLLEAALDKRYPGQGPWFRRLGKPFAPIFVEGAGRLGTTRALMVGDQLETDIRGARQFGLDAALVSTGLAEHLQDLDALPWPPTWILTSIAPEPCPDSPNRP